MGREREHFDPNAVFFDAVRQDPVLSRVKLIAEPWDVGPNGYQLGRFPPGWAEWNGSYRDEMRSYWKGDDGFLPAFSRRILGSSDLFDHQGRKPWASVNFVTAHDGFTLADLWAYNDKHNEANGEGNRDGHDDNRSWNCGVEGPTDDPAILKLRDRMRRNIVATMLLSQGTPMLLMGDEVGRSQNGNNNAYCQDNEIAWQTWKEIGKRDAAFMAFVQGVMRIRKRYRLLRHSRFLHGEPVDDNGTRSVTWLRPDGKEMEPASWTDATAKVVGLLLSDAKTRLLILVNAYHEGISFALPNSGLAETWDLRIDTFEGSIDPPDRSYAAGATVMLEGRTLLLFAGAPA
jgi:glycogen operon protein